MAPELHDDGLKKIENNIYVLEKWNKILRCR